jgi:hypothetical protein
MEYDFEVLYKTDNYNEQRGLEEVIYEESKAPLDKIRPISLGNENITKYRNAAQG